MTVSGRSGMLITDGIEQASILYAQAGIPYDLAIWTKLLPRDEDYGRHFVRAVP